MYPGFPNQYQRRDVPGIDGGESGSEDLRGNQPGQYVQADQAGQKQMLLYVPVHTEDPDTQDNWPHSVVLLPRITNTLYEHGIINYPIDITVVPSVEMNEKYHLEIPQGE